MSIMLYSCFWIVGTRRKSTRRVRRESSAVGLPRQKSGAIHFSSLRGSACGFHGPPPSVCIPTETVGTRKEKSPRHGASSSSLRVLRAFRGDVLSSATTKSTKDTKSELGKQFSRNRGRPCSMRLPCPPPPAYGSTSPVLLSVCPLP